MFSGLKVLTKAIRIISGNFRDAVANSNPDWWWRLDETTDTVAADEVGSDDLTYDSPADTAGYDVASSSPTVDGRAKDIDADADRSIYDSTALTTREVQFVGGVTVNNYQRIIDSRSPQNWWENTQLDGRVGNGFADKGTDDAAVVHSNIATHNIYTGRGVDRDMVHDQIWSHAITNDAAPPAAGSIVLRRLNPVDTSKVNLAGKWTLMMNIRYYYSAGIGTALQHIIGNHEDGTTSEWSLRVQNAGGYQLRFTYWDAGGTAYATNFPATLGFFDEDGFLDTGGAQGGNFKWWVIECDDPSQSGARIRLWIDNVLIDDQPLNGAGTAMRTNSCSFYMGCNGPEFTGTQYASFDYGDVIITRDHYTRREHQIVWDYIQVANSYTLNPNDSRYPKYLPAYPQSMAVEIAFSRPVHWVQLDANNGTANRFRDAAQPINDYWVLNNSLAGPPSSPYIGSASQEFSAFGNNFRYQNGDSPRHKTAIDIFDWCIDFAADNFPNIQNGFEALFGRFNDNQNERNELILQVDNGNNRFRVVTNYNGTETIYFLGYAGSVLDTDSGFHYIQIRYNRRGLRRLQLWVDGEIIDDEVVTGELCRPQITATLPYSANLGLRTPPGSPRMRMDQFQFYKGRAAAEAPDMQRRYSWWANNVRRYGEPGDSSVCYTMDDADISGTTITDISQFNAARDGTFLNTPSTSAAEGWGQKVAFDGTQAIELATATFLDQGTQLFITIVCSINNTGAEQTLFANYSQNPNFAGYRFYVNAAGQLAVDRGDNTSPTPQTFTTTDSYDDGVTRIYTAIIRETSMNIYANNSLNNSGTISTMTMAYNSPLPRVGCSNATGTNISFLDGTIELIAVTTRLDDIEAVQPLAWWGGGLPNDDRLVLPSDPTVLWDPSYRDGNTIINQGSRGTSYNLITDVGDLTTAIDNNVEWQSSLTCDTTNSYDTNLNPWLPTLYQADFSIVVRFKALPNVASNAGDGIGNIVSCANFTNEGFLIELNVNNGINRVLVGNNATYSSVGVGSVSTDVRDGRWHTLILTHEDLGVDGECYAYLDGAARVSPTTITGRAYVGDTFNVLSRAGTDRYLQNFELGPIEVYQRLLTADEINAISTDSSFSQSGNFTIGDLTQDFTIQVAFNIGSGQAVTGMRLLAKEVEDVCWNVQLADGSTNQLVFTLFESDGTTDRSQTISTNLSTDGVTDDDAWHFLQIRMDYSGTGLLKAWIDCTEVFSVDASTWSGNWLQSAQSRFTIGNDDLNGANPWGGAVDEPIIHKSAIPDGQISSICNLWNGGGQTVYQVTVQPTSVSDTVPNGAYTTPLLTATVQGGVGPFTYAWTSDGGNLTPDSPTAQSTTFSGNENGVTTTETLTVTVTDTGNGNEQTTFDIPTNVTWATAISVGLDITSIDESVPAAPYTTALVTATVTGGTGPYDFEWNRISGNTTIFDADNPTQSGASLTFASTFSGTGNNQQAFETWEVTVTDSLGQMDTAQLTIDVEFGAIPALLVTLSQNIVNGYTESGTLTTVPISVLATGGQPPYSYSWARVSGDTVFNPSNATGQIPTFTGSAADGTNSSEVWRVTVTDSSPVPQNETADITINCEFAAAAGDLTVDVDKSIIFYNGPNGDVGTEFVEATAMGGTPPYTYQWDLFGINRRGGSINITDFEPGAFQSNRTNFRGWLNNADVVYTFSVTVTDSTPGTPRVASNLVQVDVVTY